MDSPREIKRVFNTCSNCQQPFGDCCCQAARTPEEGLRYYLQYRERLAQLEERESDCNCGDFYTCDLCRETAEHTHRLRELMNEFGDSWAMKLTAPSGGSRDATAGSQNGSQVSSTENGTGCVLKADMDAMRVAASRASGTAPDYPSLMREYDTILEREAGESIGEDNINRIADFLSRRAASGTEGREALGNALADKAEKMLVASSGGWTERAELNAAIVAWREALAASRSGEKGDKKLRAFTSCAGNRQPINMAQSAWGRSGTARCVAALSSPAFDWKYTHHQRGIGSFSIGHREHGGTSIFTLTVAGSAHET